MRNINEFPDQEFINNLYRDFYKDNIKPLSIDFDSQNKKIKLMYKHNDFINLFGNEFNMDEIYILSINAYRLIRQFANDNGLILSVTTNITKSEVDNRKLIKMWNIGGV